jgi:hypothetical protein
VLDNNDGASLLQNLQSLASSWRSSIGSDGALIFYIDN